MYKSLVVEDRCALYLIVIFCTGSSFSLKANLILGDYYSSFLNL
ncbi:hypothetical protein SAMN03097723_1530 [Pantoea eucalypti]|nr:hypothetical protein SAMN03097723_1530 [Pantoea eucalypti]